MPIISSTSRKSITSFGNKREREVILDSFEAAIKRVSPIALIEKELHVSSSQLSLPRFGLRFDLKQFEKIVVVGGGKASGYLAQGLEKKLGGFITYGCVNILEGTKSFFHTTRIMLNEASHPVPNEAGVKGVQHMLKLLRGLDRSSLAVCLISGGGSSLMPLPAYGTTLEDLTATTDLLLRSGANIDQMNCIRKHISSIAGGQLVREGNGATFLSLIISDVVGDHLGSIASGPTAADETTFSDARRMLSELKLWDRIPPRTRTRIEEGCSGLVKETPKPGDPIFSVVHNTILGANELACDSAKRELAKRLKRPISVKYLGSTTVGEASVVARNLVQRALRFGNKSRLARCASVWGGETTVTVRGPGVGGRNQEEALSALITIGEAKDETLTIGFIGTDGIDGKTEAAGVIIDSTAYCKAVQLGLNPREFLKQNDSNSFFRKLGNSLVLTGPTGTNVNDIGIALFFKTRKSCGKKKKQRRTVHP